MRGKCLQSIKNSSWVLSSGVKLDIVRYRFEHWKINFFPLSSHVLSGVLCYFKKTLNEKIYDNCRNFSDIFGSFLRFLKIVRRVPESSTNNFDHFRTLPTIFAERQRVTFFNYFYVQRLSDDDLILCTPKFWMIPNFPY